MSALAASDCERLARLLGMLGSDHAGERDNAGRAAHRMVQQHGITQAVAISAPVLQAAISPTPGRCPPSRMWVPAMSAGIAPEDAGMPA